MPSIADIANAAAAAIGTFTGSQAAAATTAETKKEEVVAKTNTIKYVAMGAIGLVLVLTITYFLIKRK